MDDNKIMHEAVKFCNESPLRGNLKGIKKFKSQITQKMVPTPPLQPIVLPIKTIPAFKMGSLLFRAFFEKNHEAKNPSHHTITHLDFLRKMIPNLDR